jgi:DNA polymerase-1
MKKLFLLDGMALVYRAYFAFSQNPRVTSYGLNTSAVFGFTNTLLDLFRRENPSHIAVVFDTAAPTERHIEFEQYKAHREAMPEDLAKNIPLVFKLLNGMRIPVITMDGYEADDIIGTLAKKAKTLGYTTYMMTPDKDFAQLVEENIYIYKPARLGNDVEIIGVEEVLKKWEIENVSQVIDILGLWGDAVDNIPGVPGVGEKTAKSLIKEYGSMENIYENIEKLKGKQKENFTNFKEQALLSKRLATINLNVPIEIDERGLLLEPYDKPAIEELFKELEFKTLAQRLFADNTTAEQGKQTNLFGEAVPQALNKKISVSTPEEGEPVYNTIGNVVHNYILVDTVEKRKDLIAELLAQKSICFDTETTAAEPMWADIVGMSFSFKAGTGYYIPLPESFEAAKTILKEFASIFESEQIEKIGQNIKYDYIILGHYGIEVKGKLFDTMLAHYLIEPDMRHNMDALSMAYLNYKPVSITELIGKKGAGQGNMRTVDINLVKEYASEDADITLQLRDYLLPKLPERNAEKLLYEVEQPLIEVLASIEREGVRIDKAFLDSYSGELEKEIALAELEVYRCAGIKFNIGSPKQLGEVLFDQMKLTDKPKKTATGQYKTDEDVLSSLSEHEIVKYILDYRQFGKLKSTYVDSLPRLINPKTGRVHTSFNQAVAATGRLSSDKPNLQNIPIRTDKGKEVRKAFIPRDENHVLISADYSQIELRIIAAISKDENMIDAFKNGYDIHQATAAKIYNISMDEVTKDMRRNAKSVNFGIVYGISAFGLSQNLGIPRKEAAEIIDNYFNTYPGIKQYMNSQVDLARERGYVETILGRRRYLRDINSANANVRGFAERNAINAPIQGSAADMIKLAMINIYKKLKGMNIKTRMILQVHDELLFDAPKDEVALVSPIIVEGMVNALPLDVPIVAEIGFGENWLAAH